MDRNLGSQEPDLNQRQITLEQLRGLIGQLYDNKKELEKLKIEKLNNLEKSMHTELELQSQKILNEELDRQLKRAADDFASKLQALSQKTERELKRMIEVVAEKDYIIQATKKQCSNLQSRIQYVESENLNIKNSMTNLETLISQELEVAKNTIKQLQEELKEHELDRGLVDNKYAGLAERYQKILARVDASQEQLHKSQEEAAQLRIQLREANRKLQDIAAREKRATFTKSKPMFSQNSMIVENAEPETQSADAISKLLTSHQEILKNMMASLNLATKEVEECSIIKQKYQEQVEHNKELCKQLEVMEEVQLSYIKKYDEAKFTQIFEERNPAVIRYFEAKVPQFQAFEQKLYNIEGVITRAEEMLKNALRNPQEESKACSQVPGQDLMTSCIKSLVEILHGEIIKLEDELGRQKKGKRSSIEKISRCCFCWGRLKATDMGVVNCKKCQTNRIHDNCFKYEVFSDCPYYQLNNS